MNMVGKKLAHTCKGVSSTWLLNMVQEITLPIQEF